MVTVIDLFRDIRTSYALYWQEYRRRIGAAILALGGFSLLVLWIFSIIYDDWSGDWKHIAELSHPLTLLLAFLGGVWTSGLISARLSDLRSRTLPPPLEEQEDPTTKPWRRINHSFPDLGWIPDIPWNERQVIRQQLRWTARWGLPVFEFLREETGTRNYRIFSFFGPARFLRIHMNPSELDLWYRTLVTDHLGKEALEKEAIFDERFLRCLKPLSLRKATNAHLKYKQLPATPFKSSGSVWAQLFPYAHGVEHYNGKELRELESVANAIGRLQASLQRLDCTLDASERDRLCKNPRTDRLRTSGEVDTDWNRIVEKVEEVKEQREGNHFAKLLSDMELQEVGKWIQEASRLRNGEERRSLLLHDVHPHNVFCKESRCVLIYDYSWIGYWPHSLVVALSLHRFVREYAIKNADDGCGDSREERIRKLVATGISSFLNSYEGKPKRKNLPNLPSEFRSNLKAYIRCSNIDKLLASFEIGLGIKEESLGRSRERQLGEGRKFVRFMKEAEEFSDF